MEKSEIISVTLSIIAIGLLLSSIVLSRGTTVITVDDILRSEHNKRTSESLLIQSWVVNRDTMEILERCGLLSCNATEDEVSSCRKYISYFKRQAEIALNDTETLE